MPAIKPHPTATTNVPWDGPKAVSNLKTGGTEAYYKSASAWQSADGDPTLKGSYKFVHHMVSASGEVGAASTSACMSGMKILNGARNMPDIPAADFPGVHAHLAKHVTDAGMKPVAMNMPKSDESEESKVANPSNWWEENDTALRHRLKEPMAFEPGTFRTITIQKTKPRVMGVVAKLKDGNGSMVLQTLVFPKDEGWTMDKAKRWAGKNNFKEQDFSDAIGGIKETKDFTFEVKEVTETGSFTGMLSVYNELDLGGDIVEPGAFDKSLQECGFVIPCQWQHKEVIGMLKVTPIETGLWVDGQLALDTIPNGTPMVPEAFKALALMRMKVVKGLSIGYKALKAPFEAGVRKLKEVRLLEGSIVTFPMLPMAQVLSVKSEGEEKGSFDEELMHIQIMAARYQMMQALSSSLDSILMCPDIPISEKPTQSQSSIASFSTAYVAMLPEYMDMMGMMDNTDMGTEDAPMKSYPFLDLKVGRTISSASADKIREAIQVLQSLLGETTTLADPAMESSADSEEDRAAAGAATAEATKSEPVEPEPEATSLPPLNPVAEGLNDLKGLFKWQN